MTPDEAVVAVLDALDGADIPYMLVGTLASNFHGIPRSTRDADFVVQLEEDRLQRLQAELSADLVLQSQGAFEAITGTTRFVVTLVGSPFVCELFGLSDDAHDRERFARRTAVSVLGRRAFVATAEDMIVTKLRWAIAAQRSKDRDDIRNIIAVRGSDLDWEYVNRWTAAHGTSRLLADIRASIRVG